MRIRKLNGNSPGHSSISLRGSGHTPATFCLRTPRDSGFNREYPLASERVLLRLYVAGVLISHTAALKSEPQILSDGRFIPKGR